MITLLLLVPIFLIADVILPCSRHTETYLSLRLSWLLPFLRSSGSLCPSSRPSYHSRFATPETRPIWPRRQHAGGCRSTTARPSSCCGKWCHAGCLAHRRPSLPVPVRDTFSHQYDEFGDEQRTELPKYYHDPLRGLLFLRILGSSSSATDSADGLWRLRSSRETFQQYEQLFAESADFIDNSDVRP